MNNAKSIILAIDDTPENLLTLGASLGADYDLQIATSGAVGLALAAEMPPDLILLDVMMPEMDGYETCRRLKLEPRLRSIPVIFVTALSDSAAENVGLALGAADYITKPINLGIARQRIGNLLEREQLRKEVEAQRDHLEQLVAARTLALSIAKEAAEKADRAKSVFLDNISHEQRTPMTIIMGMTDLALLRATDSEQAEILGLVKQSSVQLLALINNVIDVTCLETGRLTIERSEFRLVGVLDKLTGLLGQDAASKGLELRIEAEPALANLPLQGDALRIEQILLNMIDNAIKFTARGRIDVSACLTEEGPLDVLLRFEVRDTGIGIAPRDQQRIFNLFEQTDGSSTRDYGGTGLGLALCKQLIELMGGTTGVESQLGSGSVFWFTARLRKHVGDIVATKISTTAHHGVLSEVFPARLSGLRWTECENQQPA